jgi:hypothetical protein
MTDIFWKHELTPDRKKEIDDNLTEWVANKKLTRTDEQAEKAEFRQPTEEDIIAFKEALNDVKDFIKKVEGW